jgi:uncharacterized protein (DUF58 family)
VPTRSGWLLALGAVASAVGGRLFGTLELYVLAAAAGALLVVAVVLARRPLPPVDVERRALPLRPSVGATARVEMTVRTPGDRSIPVLTLVDPVEGTVGARVTIGPIAPTATLDVGYRLPTRRRGRLAIGPLEAERSDPFGLARRRTIVADRTELTVLPRIDVLPARAIGGGLAEPLEGVSQRAFAAVASEDLSTLRPYQVGDDLRRVHWPSSAHADDLLVRRDEERWQGHATVLLDCRRHALDPDAFERAVSAAASLVHAIAQSGDRVRLVTTVGLDSGMVDARRNEGVLLEELAIVEQHEGELAPAPLPERTGTESLVVLAGDRADELVAPGYGRHRSFSFVDDRLPFARRWIGGES